ncbi:unnamed protein product [Ambrosiozyma monospora]|uniref:Unnamed protein product n=1 Tax=Ambrosiozyma monospora TaxID=43982 RepID=A0A9W6YUN4_AMBMO|nr:unnamed protein product [Ambrosiozyma monospora]
MFFNVLLQLAVTLIDVTSAAPLPSTYVDAQPLKIVSFASQFRYADNELVTKLQKRDEVVDAKFHQTVITFPLSIDSQEITLVADTGSYSTWALNESVGGTLCDNGSCINATNVDTSSDDYSISYIGGFSASGKLATGTVSVGDSSSSASDFKFGLVDSSSGDNGGYSWCGLGYNTDYSSNNQQLLDVLQNGGVIDKKIFSLEYETENLDFGSDVMGSAKLTFGGYDESNSEIKFFSQSHTSSLQTSFKSVSQGSNSVDASGSKNILFDSGSTNFSAKKKYIDAIEANYTTNANYESFFTCSDYTDTTVKFQFDDSSALEIPFLDFAWTYYQDSYDLCQLMVDTLSDDDEFEMVFGQYALKNLVTVFDVENKQVGIAPKKAGSKWA